jgi:hypothetical protein
MSREDEETYFENMTRVICDQNKNRLAEYVKNPKTFEEKVKNKSIKKFIEEKLIERVMDSFEEWYKWMVDEDLSFLRRKWVVLMAGGEIPYSMMKRIVLENHSIPEAVELFLDGLK